MRVDARRRSRLNLEARLRWLIAIRLLVVASVVVPYLLLNIVASGETAEEKAAEALLIATSNATELGTPEDELARRGSASSVRDQLQKEVEELSARIESERLHEHQLVAWLVGWVSIQTLLCIVALRLLRPWPVLQAYLQFFGDIGMITLCIYRLGEGAASLSILYLIVIIVASVLLRRSAGLVVATASFLSLAGVTLLPAFVHGFTPSFASLATHPAADNLVIHLLGFYAVAVLTSYLARDVTRVEEQLREANLEMSYLQVLHADIIQSMTTGLATIDLEGKITTLNRAGERMLGARSSRLLGVLVGDSPLAELEPWIPDPKDEPDGHPSRRLRSEIDCTLADGETIRIGFTLTKLRDGQGIQRGFILLFRDLTLWNKLEERVRLQDRMAAMGEMAAGLAHEVGNPLAAISGSVQMLASTLPHDISHRKLLDIILKESRRLDRSVKDFLHFARPREVNPVEFDVAQLLAEDVELLRNSSEVSENHVVEIDLQPRSTLILADQDQISQVFWNLALNALQAMPSGGTLTISGRVEANSYRLAVSDTGSGMSELERAKLFQPYKSFFDRGTGIGMAIVYRIVEDHDGSIGVESAPDKGSTVTVELPLNLGQTPLQHNSVSSRESHETSTPSG